MDGDREEDVWITDMPLARSSSLFLLRCAWHVLGRKSACHFAIPAGTVTACNAYHMIALEKVNWRFPVVSRLSPGALSPGARSIWCLETTWTPCEIDDRTG